ncbi:MAG: dienelactone hydrolase family protein, partial [Actinomycetota bacterium]
LAQPLYLGIGEADEVQSIAMHQRFLDAVADLDHVDVRTFPGADHGYTWPGYPTYDETAAETSWTVTLEMIGSAFGRG